MLRTFNAGQLGSAGAVAAGFAVTFFVAAATASGPYYVGAGIAFSIIAALLLYSAWKAHQRQHAHSASRQWSVRSHGEVADIRVLDDTLTRYAVALDVVVYNGGSAPVTVLSTLAMQWGHPSTEPLLSAREVPIAGWEAICKAFRLEPKRQLTLPLTVGPGETASGHIVFDVPDAGAGVEFIGTSLDGPEAATEGTRHDRHYHLEFAYNPHGITDHPHLPVRTVFAPQLDHQMRMASDLAVAGSAATWVRR
jgi:hypothetical protein